MTPSAQLSAFLARFDPPVENTARACLAWMRKITPGAMERVYDAYNALSIGFSSGDSLRETFVHVAVYPKHVNVGFNYGADLDDPRGELVGTGARVRHVRVEDPKRLDAYLAKLVRAAAKNAGYRKKPGAKRGELKIVAIYARQRPRQSR